MRRTQTAMAKPAQLPTVERLLSGKLTELWLPVKLLGYDTDGKPVVSKSTVGAKRPVPGQINVRLIRIQGELTIVKVAGLELYGLTKQVGHGPGQYWLMDNWRCTVKPGTPVKGGRPKTLADAIPGKVVRLKDQPNLKTPPINKSDKLINRSIQLRADNSGVPMIYLGDLGLLNLGSRWYELEIVPQH